MARRRTVDAKPGYKGLVDQVTTWVYSPMWEELRTRMLRSTWGLMIQDALEIFGDLHAPPSDQDYAAHRYGEPPGATRNAADHTIVNAKVPRVVMRDVEIEAARWGASVAEIVEIALAAYHATSLDPPNRGLARWTPEGRLVRGPDFAVKREALRVEARKWVKSGSKRR